MSAGTDRELQNKMGYKPLFFSKMKQPTRKSCVPDFLTNLCVFNTFRCIHGNMSIYMYRKIIWKHEGHAQYKLHTNHNQDVTYIEMHFLLVFSMFVSYNHVVHLEKQNHNMFLQLKCFPLCFVIGKILLVTVIDIVFVSGGTCDLLRS